MNRIPVEVRPLAEDEIGALETGLRRYTTETHRDRFAEQKAGHTVYLVAWAGEEPAGYARLKWQPTFMMGLALRDTPSIGDVTVRPDLRSRGIGAQIMRTAEDLVRSRGLSRLALGVEVDNARAIDFYHRLGYFDAGIPPERSSRYLLAEDELWHEGDSCICLVKDLQVQQGILALGRAKINLAHVVGGRRRDGYHSVRTILQSISLADEMTINPGRGVYLAWAAGLGGDLPLSPDLVERTLRSASRKSSRARKLAVTVTKRIPLGAGLGGGSADAAACLKSLGVLDPEIFSPQVILRQARRLGADVPFCLTGGLAGAGGRGDRLRPLPVRMRLWWVVGIPSFTLSTEQVYARFDDLNPDPGEPARPGALAQLEKALSAGDLINVGANLRNDLEAPAFDLRPELKALKQAMLSAGATGAVMTGSGSAIVGLCETEGEAGAVAAKARRVFSRVEVSVSTTVGSEVVGQSPASGRTPADAVLATAASGGGD